MGENISSTSQLSGDQQGLGAGAVAGIIVGVSVVAVVLLAGLMVWRLKRGPPKAAAIDATAVNVFFAGGGSTDLDSVNHTVTETPEGPIPSYEETKGDAGASSSQAGEIQMVEGHLI